MGTTLIERYDSLPNDQFIQYTIDIDYLLIGKYGNNPCFVVRGKTTRRKYMSTECVSLFYEHDKKVSQLFFILEDLHFIDVFEELIDDIQTVLVSSKGNRVDLAYTRWCLWKDMFSSKKKDTLSQHQIQGLIGELTFLKSFMFKTYGIKRSILAWGGPNYLKKDFEIDKTWYEVKTVLHNGKGTIKVSSLEQLESNYDGYLEVVSLEKTTPTNKERISLNILINEIVQNIDRVDLLDLFLLKLKEYGYVYGKMYDEYCYVIKGIDTYLVNDSFPCLTHKNIPSSVLKCSYTLMLDAIRDYKK